MSKNPYIMMRKGATDLMTSERGLFVIPEDTNRLRPKGGVRKPISMLTTMMIPK